MAQMNMQQMMKQARKMQEQLAAAQEDHRAVHGRCLRPAAAWSRSP